MKTVLLCAPTREFRVRLQAELAQEGFTVETADGHNEVLALLKEKRRDAVVAEARRDRFADFLRQLLTLRPGTIVHLFQDDLVFCHFPQNRQPVSLLFALDNAGLTLPGSRKPLPAPEAVVLNV